MAADDSASSISVAVRVRPFTIREAAQLAKTDDGPLFLGDGSLAAAPTPKLSQKGLRSIIKVVDEKCLVFDPPEDNPVQKFSKSIVPQGKRVKDQTFGFDRVFDENTSQGDVYDATTKNLLDSVLDGYNATVFAYGATGCGKTHTITGTAQQPGIIFLTMQELFERIQDVQQDKVTEISLSYLEIYNETIRDLLVQGGGKTGLMLREDQNQAVSVAGLSSHHPQNVQEVMDMIVRGNEYRTMSPTEANATSSRSHAVLQINLSQKDRNADINEPHTMATLSIIDLAGSERASATKNRGDRLLEGANINKSLLALGSCINALCDPRKRNHVPYRNSKLTRLLKFSLGGNCKTVMIVCVSPSSAHFDETQNTLRYANRAKNIQTKVTRNVYNVNRHVKDFLKKIDEQRQQIDELKAAQKEFESIAFSKFRRLNEKKEGIAKEGVQRIRASYEHSAVERQERTNSMRKLRQIERRIGMLSAWIAAFDNVCETREEEDPPRNLLAMRKTAQGIQAELEGSRQHYHQRLAKNKWERSLDAALQTGVRQLQEQQNDGAVENSDIANLTREAELLKAKGERETYSSILDQERSGDAAMVQVLLTAHFETIAILNQILHMDEQEAIEAAKSVLTKMLTSCSDATSQVIKPDGGLGLPPTEVFPPTKQGTPKRRKGANLMGPSPVRPRLNASLLAETSQTSNMSPIKASPRRRPRIGISRKGVAFTPKKKSPAKTKRAVRWRDDTEDGTLAEFEKTPVQLASTPEKPAFEELPTSKPSPNPPWPPTALTSSINMTAVEGPGSSPIPAPPESSIEFKPRNNRFQAGFLSKATTTSSNTSPSLPPPPTLNSAIHLTSSSPSEPSPLREISSNANALPHTTRSPLSNATSAGPTPPASHSPSASDSDTSTTSASCKKNYSTPAWDDPAILAKHVRHSLSARDAFLAPGSRQRRRSPTGSSASPPAAEGGAALFSASQARRMVRSSADELAGSVGGRNSVSVLSPRVGAAMVAKGRDGMGAMGQGRRMTSDGSGGVGGRGRLSSVMAGGGVRGAGMGGRGVWR
ncbi:MAG: kinesin-like protein Klp5 [Bathelium mastoideum]|nr:MAG: kinesin-like protein Klp5 [Bathelium mastoideum]